MYVVLREVYKHVHRVCGMHAIVLQVNVKLVLFWRVHAVHKRVLKVVQMERGEHVAVSQVIAKKVRP